MLPIKYILDRVANFDPDLLTCGDVIISRKDLIDKINSINLLEMRLNEQMSEFMYEKKQSESTFSDEMKKVHEDYCSAIEELKVG